MSTWIPRLKYMSSNPSPRHYSKITTRRGGVRVPHHLPSTTGKHLIWKPIRVIPLAAIQPSTSLISQVCPFTNSQSLDKKSVQASTSNAHGSHCSMTQLACTASLSHALTSIAHDRVNIDLAQAPFVPPMHHHIDGISLRCPEDNKQEGGALGGNA